MLERIKVIVRREATRKKTSWLHFQKTLWYKEHAGEASWRRAGGGNGGPSAWCGGREGLGARRGEGSGGEGKGNDKERRRQREQRQRQRHAEAMTKARGSSCANSRGNERERER